jgi:hypothetical protein
MVKNDGVELFLPDQIRPLIGFIAILRAIRVLSMTAPLRRGRPSRRRQASLTKRGTREKSALDDFCLSFIMSPNLPAGVSAKNRSVPRRLYRSIDDRPAPVRLISSPPGGRAR